MRIILIISIFLILCFVKKIQAQNNNFAKIDSVPQLTYQQMVKEYDTLLDYIIQISPIIYYNQEVRGINFHDYVQKIKRKITPKTTLSEYLNFVYRTINVAQDNHTNLLSEDYIRNTIQKYWIPSGIKVIGYDSIGVNYAKYYDAYFGQIFNTPLNLELVYASGEYYNLLPFSYKNKKFPSRMKLIKCNGKDVHKVVKNMIDLVSALKWDKTHNKTYFEKFYKSPFIYERDTLNLVFEDNNKTLHILNIGRYDTVTFLAQKKNKFGYNNDAKIKTHFFENEHIFYARLPKMEENLGDSISHHLKKFIEKNNVKAIILDIRGNPGGSDITYANILKKVIKKPLLTNVIVGRLFTPINCAYNEITEDSIPKYPHLSLKLENIPTLKTAKMFYIKMLNYQHTISDSIQYPFDGKIYILQDRFIYSSASNLSNLAYNSEQLITIGENPNLLGGMQTTPIVICLPYSKLFLRIEPQIDFSNIKNKADIFQNNVEYPVSYPIEFIYEKITTDTDILGKDFLYNKDPMIRKVIELEKNKK